MMTRSGEIRSLRDRPAEAGDALAFSRLLEDFGRLLAGEYDRRVPLNRGQSAIISLLIERDGRTQTELAEAIGLHKVSIGAHVEHLEALKLVERRPHPTDRRSKQVWLTPYFHAVRHVGEQVFADVHARAVEGIPAADYRTAMKVLARMRDNLRRMRSES